MVQAPARLLSPWVAVLLSAAGLAGCGTPPQPLPPPVAPAASSAPGPVATGAPVPASAEALPAPASAPTTQADAVVAARFPDPAVNYRTPAFENGHPGFTSNAELQALLRGLVRDGAPHATLLKLGTSQNGVPLDALLFTRNADASPAALQRSGRPTVMLVAQQHGDEPAGSEALIVLAQELARGRLQTLLDRINVVMLLRANPDGAQANRRSTANGLDADRDHLLLKTPEAQAQARLVREFQPLVVVDAREYEVSSLYQQKFGFVQRHDLQLQYAMTANLPPFFTKASEEWFREPLLASLKQQGLSSEWLHTTTADLADKTLAMGGPLPDSGRNVQGLKNAVSLVIETRGAGLGRAHLKRRVHTHVTALSSVLQSAAARGGDLLKLRQYVDAEVSAQACQGLMVVEAGPTPTEYTLQGLDPVTGADKMLTVNWDSALVLRELKARNRPCGYWLAADQADAVARLRMLGVRVEQALEKGVVQGETYSQAPSQPGATRLELKPLSALLDVPVGSFYVPLSQPLANLVVAALEPDTSASYLANGVVSGPNKQARVMALPGVKLAVMP
jgi:hypothetical protein